MSELKINGKSIYSMFTRKDYGYFYWCVKHKGMTNEEAIRETIKTRDTRGTSYSKYKINGIPIYHLLNHRDYGYFQMLINKKNMPYQKAYEMTIATKPKEGRRQTIAGNRKYFYKGKSIREIYKDRNDRGLFYTNISMRKMSMEDAIKATNRAIKAREKRWDLYRKEQAKSQKI